MTAYPPQSTADSDRFYVAPTTQGQQLDNKPRLGDGMAPIPGPGIAELTQLLGSQQRPAAIDIGPLVAIIDREMQRLRDQLFVEQSAARSAREALVACEERARLATASHDRVVHELEHARCDASEAQRMLMDERAKSKGLECQLRPGSTAAVIEAYRLLCGEEPVQIRNSMNKPEWVDQAWPEGALPSPDLGQIYRAAHELLRWLDEHASRGRP